MYAATTASPPTFQKNPTDYEILNDGLLALLMWHCTSMVKVLGLNPVPTPTKVKSTKQEEALLGLNVLSLGP